METRFHHWHMISMGMERREWENPENQVLVSGITMGDGSGQSDVELGNDD